MIGQIISHYRVLEKLGDGGMGVVYKAEDLDLKRHVALKFLPLRLSSDPEWKSRFKREAQTASALEHPNVCTVHEIAETDAGELFICMSYCDGGSVHDLMQRGPLPLAAAVDIASQVCDALSEAHRCEIVHRDIKPGNVMLMRSGLVKIVDFGIAKLREGGKGKKGFTLGSPAYMSPEQAMGLEVDHRTDIWALGVVLFEMLTGVRPFADERNQQVMNSVVYREATRVAELDPSLPSELQAIFDRTFQKDPDERYATAADLKRVLEALVAVAQPPTVEPMVAESGSTSIATLPFEDLSPDGDQQWFCDGLAEEVAIALTRTEGLRVTGRTSTLRYKGAAVDVRQVGQELNVGHVLEGSVRKEGDRFRITVQLLDTRDGMSRWTERYDREMKDIFTTQDEIAQSIARALELHLAVKAHTSSAQRHSTNVEAYDAYLRGRYFWNLRTEESLLQGLECFIRARELDLEYAQAYVGIADSYVMLGGVYGAMPPKEAMPLGRYAAERALKLDPSLAAARCSLAAIHSLYDWDWDAAETGYREAIRLDPGYATAHQWYAMQFLVPRSRFAEAKASLDRAQELDPTSPSVQVSRGIMSYYEGDYERAIHECKRTLDVAADFVLAHAFLGLASVRTQRYADAALALEVALSLSGRSSDVIAWAGQVLARAGLRERAEELRHELVTLSENRYVPPVRLAELSLCLDDADGAFHWLERARETRDGLLIWIRVNPIFEPIRRFPILRPLLDDLG